MTKEMCGAPGEYFKRWTNLFLGTWESYWKKVTASWDLKQELGEESSWHRERHGEQKEVPCVWNTENNENEARNESAEVGKSQIMQDSVIY